MTSCLTCLDGNYIMRNDFGNVDCVQCSRGYECTEGERRKCQRGTYAESGWTSCRNCPSGMFNLNDGASSCEECGLGRFTALSEDSDVVVVEGATFCNPCPAGHRCTGSEKFLCDLGSYSLQESSECLSCGPGRSARKGRDGCDDCPTGSYSAFHAFTLSDGDACEEMDATISNNKLLKVMRECIVREDG